MSRRKQVLSTSIFFLQTIDFPFLILLFVAFCDCVCHLRLDNSPCWIGNIANTTHFNNKVVLTLSKADRGTHKKHQKTSINPG